ncbi:MAG: TetR/AcrR family transcriptional regulator [Sporolactobacillus sp.]
MANDLRVQKTKAAIIEAFIDLLNVKDFAAITVRDIADAAHVGRGTFYLHYQDKYDLLNTLADDCIDQISKDFHPMQLFKDKQINTERIKAYLIRNLSILEKNARIYRAVLFGEGVPSFGKKLRERLMDVAYHEFPALIPQSARSAELEILPQFFSSGLLGLLDWWFRTDMRTSKETLARVLISILTVGPFQSLGFRFTQSNTHNYDEKV